MCLGEGQGASLAPAACSEMGLPRYPARGPGRDNTGRRLRASTLSTRILWRWGSPSIPHPALSRPHAHVRVTNPAPPLPASLTLARSPALVTWESLPVSDKRSWAAPSKYYPILPQLLIHRQASGARYCLGALSSSATSRDWPLSPSWLICVMRSGNRTNFLAS